MGRARTALLTALLGVMAGAGCASAKGADQDAAGAGTCPARPDLAAAAPACNTVGNAAAAIAATATTGSAPTPAGGVLRDGLYEATRAESYGGAAGSGRRITLVVLAGATRMLWAGEVLDPTGTTVTLSFRADTTLAASGTRITFTTSCVSSTPSPIPAALDFTASGDTLVLQLATGSTTAVTTYTRRGCAP